MAEERAFLQMSARTQPEKFREVSWAGRPHLVVPATLVKSQVLHNNLGATYLPADALTEEWAALWNSVPVVLDHPTKNGKPISARDPAVLNGMMVGFTFNARIQDDALKADVYLDLGRVDDLEELAQIVDNVREGKPVELSTGFPSMVEYQHGVHNGTEYEVIMYPVGADHLAVFATKQGACSVGDGCGLGVNCSCQDERTEAMDAKTAGRFSAAVEKFVDWASRLGPQNEREGEGSGSEEAQNESDEDRRAFLRDALQTTFGGPGREIWIVAVFSDENRVVFERASETAGSQLLRADYEINEEEMTVEFTEPVEVRRITEFVPAANRENDDAGDSNPTDKGEDAAMNEKQRLIAQLSQVCPLSEARLNELDEEELQALHADYEGSQEEEQEAATPPAATSDDASAAGSAEGEEPATNALAEALNALTSEITSLKEARQADQQAINELKEITRPAVEERERERESLIGTLSANELVPFDKDELETKGVEELRKLSAMSRGRNYGPRGGPKVTTTHESEPEFLSPVPHWEAQNSGAQKEEMN